jgi:Transcriptional regulator
MTDISRKERERQTREQSIIDAAERIFYENGFEEASMDEIAKAAEFTKRTVYQYFTGKEDLYFAVVLKGFRQMEAFIAGRITDDQTGFEKLERIVTGMYSFQSEKPDTFLLLSRWSYIKRKFKGETPARSSLDGFNVALFKGIEAVFVEGIADGSIKTDLTPAKSAYSVVYLAMGFMSNFALTGESFITFQKLDREEFCRTTLGLILRPFAAKAKGGTEL